MGLVGQGHLGEVLSVDFTSLQNRFADRVDGYVQGAGALPQGRGRLSRLDFHSRPHRHPVRVG